MAALLRLLWARGYLDVSGLFVGVRERVNVINDLVGRHYITQKAIDVEQRDFVGNRNPVEDGFSRHNGAIVK